VYLAVEKDSWDIERSKLVQEAGFDHWSWWVSSAKGEGSTRNSRKK